MRGVAVLGLLAGCLDASVAPDAATRDAGATDAGTADAPLSDASCSWVDEFEEDDLDVDRWRKDLDVEGGSIEVADGRVVVDSASEAGEYVYTAMVHDVSMPLAGATITARMSAQLFGPGDALLVWDDGDTWMGAGFDTGQLVAWYGDTDGFVGAVCDPCMPYDDEFLNFVRLRADADTLYFEAATAEDEWDIEIAPPQPIPFESGHFYLWAEAGDGNRAILAVEKVQLDCGGP